MRRVRFLEKRNDGGICFAANLVRYEAHQAPLHSLVNYVSIGSKSVFCGSRFVRVYGCLVARVDVESAREETSLKVSAIEIHVAHGLLMNVSAHEFFDSPRGAPYKKGGEHHHGGPRFEWLSCSENIARRLSRGHYTLE